jgi:hypothetical protein
VATSLKELVYDSQSQRAVTALPHNAQLRKLHQRARTLKATPRLAVEAAGEQTVAAMNLSTDAR